MKLAIFQNFQGDETTAPGANCSVHKKTPIKRPRPLGGLGSAWNDEKTRLRGDNRLTSSVNPCIGQFEGWIKEEMCIDFNGAPGPARSNKIAGRRRDAD